jgi:hypothetical protein
VRHGHASKEVNGIHRRRRRRQWPKPCGAFADTPSSQLASLQAKPRVTKTVLQEQLRDAPPPRSSPLVVGKWKQQVATKPLKRCPTIPELKISQAGAKPERGHGVPAPTETTRRLYRTKVPRTSPGRVTGAAVRRPRPEQAGELACTLAGSSSRCIWAVQGRDNPDAAQT